MSKTVSFLKIIKYTLIQFKVNLNIKMKRLQLKKQENTNEIRMTLENIKLCIKNQGGYQTLYLNDSLQLQYYSFVNIQNLQQFVVPPQQIQNAQTQNISETQSNQRQFIKQIKGLNTIYLNNNVISKIQNLQVLRNSLITLNLSHNQIQTFQGLNKLQKLTVLDLSYNKINQIKNQQLKGLNNLKRLNLNSNKFTKLQSIKAITQIGQTLQTLQLANNQNFLPQQQSFLKNVMIKMSGLKVLVLKQTPFARTTKAYRKQVILAIQSLTFLDQRPVTSDERFLARAWRRGGIVQQRQARKLISQKKDEKNHKILMEIQQKNKVVNQKVQKVWKIKAHKQINQLQNLIEFSKSQQYELVDCQQQAITKLRIQQLQKYLQILKQQCRNLDLDKQLGLCSQQIPKMLIQNRTSECIYIYNVSQRQLELIKQKYYKDQLLPLKAVNYEKKGQLQWLQEYNNILERVFRICKQNWDIIVPSFNLELYQFDIERGRSIKRWKKQELQQIYKNYMKSKNQNYNQDKEQLYIKGNLVEAGPNTLDCLD